MKPLLIYLITINALGLLLMLVDKYKARKNLWRISDKTLFVIALLGGSFGCLLGMYAVHHKTQHAKFTLGMPAILALQIVVAVIILIYI